jgi:hypothetical protein
MPAEMIAHFLINRGAIGTCVNFMRQSKSHSECCLENFGQILSSPDDFLGDATTGFERPALDLIEARKLR